MARKDRVPNPPRRVQAPKRRSTPTTAADAERKRKLLYAVVASTLVLVAIVLGVILLSGGDDADSVEEVRAALTAADCTLTSEPAQPGDHTAEIDATEDEQWNTEPPTSGPHYQLPAIFGSYDSPIQIAQAVHNLEHGGIYILYGEDVPEATVAELEAFYNEDPNALLLAPMPELGETIALGAWVTPDPRPGAVGEGGQGHLAECTQFDEEAFSTFRDEFRYKGPERFPQDQLHPGM